ncbi:MAG TPA: hypothetical protein VFL90_12650, partial [Methylomirabilota bacterium]|nr:hypothetical protein [Methylomirabilota bacterium]
LGDGVAMEDGHAVAANGHRALPAAVVAGAVLVGLALGATATARGAPGAGRRRLAGARRGR